MNYDILIKNGLIVDGSGSPGYYGDVAVKDGRVSEIGSVTGTAVETIDASGHVVAPGFVDGHTHMDAQLFWDHIGSPLCYHGVTTVVMGNCGFTLAPARKSEFDLVLRNLERAEDLDRKALLAGIPMSWETFPEFLDVIDRLPKGINYAGYIGHSALRTYVMGERAFTDQATDSEIHTMADLVKEAIHAGAIGFSTSRSPNHMTSDDKPVASRVASWQEVEAIVRGMGETGKGVFEIASSVKRGAEAEAYYRQLASLSSEAGRSVTFGLYNVRSSPNGCEPILRLLNELDKEGAKLYAQVQSRMIGVIASFETKTPFDSFPVWSELRSLTLVEQQKRLRDQDLRKALIASANRPPEGGIFGIGELQPPEWDSFYLMHDAQGPYRSVGEIANERGIDPVEAMIDLALDRNLKQMFIDARINENPDEVLSALQDKRALATFSDTGAHVSQIDTALQTHILGFWVRDRKALSLEAAIKKITYDTASFWGFRDRGLLKRGFAADIVIFDPDKVGPAMPEVAYDLPAGAMRLLQKATGFLLTIVNGKISVRNGKPTDVRSGQLLRA